VPSQRAFTAERASVLKNNHTITGVVLIERDSVWRLRATFVSDQLTQLLVWNIGAQIVEKARQKGEHRLIAGNAPAVNK
jgi:hypothetical protein